MGSVKLGYLRIRLGLVGLVTVGTGRISSGQGWVGKFRWGEELG